MIGKKYLKYNIGDENLNCHIDAVHAQSPNSDQFTGEIVKGVIKGRNVSGIIATISRTIMDINRPRDGKNAPAIDEFRETIREIVESKGILNENGQLTKNYLHLAIHGMNDEKPTEFEIGTRYGNSCSKEIEDWFISELERLSNSIGVNSIFPGDPSKSFHRNGDVNSRYIGYGSSFHTIQIEINRIWRRTRQKEIIGFLIQILNSFDEIFNKKESL